MSLRDDDMDEPLSSRRALERADHGKTEKVEQAKQTREKKELKKLQLQVLRQQVQPKTVDVAGGEEAKEEESQGTKTREQEAKQQIDTVEAKPGPEKLIKKEEEKKRAQEQATYEQGKDQTA